ncbi:MAG: biopolymer transport protein ExbD [Planctomycetota bacterium]|jgi:biopolymer transport protein ExbD
MAKKKSAVEEEIKMDMTPMIDVTFQLLIFFIITLKFKLLEKKLYSYLPTDFGTNATPEIVDDIFVTVKMKQKKGSTPGGNLVEQQTEYYFEQEKIKGETLGEIHQKIYQKIKSFNDQQPEAKGKIEAWSGVPHASVVSVLDLFNKAKYKTITFVGLTTNKNITAGKKWWNKVRKQLAAPQ